MTIGRSSIRMQLTDRLKNKVTKKKKVLVEENTL